MPDNQAPQRTAVYIDGFNLYHAVKGLGEPFLKWMCVRRLSEQIAQKGGFRLVKVVFCTAFPEHRSAGTRTRYRTYMNALAARGVVVIEGHYLEERDTGGWKEKQSDVNLALACIIDAEDDVYDVAYLLTADSDQAATARTFRDRFKDKRLIPVAPPGQSVPKKTQSYSQRGFVLKKADIEQCVMGPVLRGKTGFIRRPAEYDPPGWWRHPDGRA